MATKQYKVLTKAQARARRFGEKQPEVSYFDEAGQSINIVDPAMDELKEEKEVVEEVVEKPAPKKKASKKKAVEK